MKPEEILKDASALKAKFAEFYQQRKQIAALENYSFIQTFTHQERKIFSTIKFCVKGSFLKKKDAAWLMDALEEFQINYLDWAHRTKWLKEQIEQPAPKFVQPQLFDFDQKKSAMPSLDKFFLAAKQKQISARV